MSNENEEVLVVITEELKSVIGNATGFLKFDRRALELMKSKSFFVPREKAENDEGIKQIIPYCVVINENKILAVKRKNPGETRLKDKIAIAIGGHVNPADNSDGDVIRNAAVRELAEELKFSAEAGPKPTGFINLDDIPVNRVHFGVVYRVDLGADVTVIDDGLEGNFVSISELPNLTDKMEGWSKILAEKITAGEIDFSGAAYGNRTLAGARNSN